MPAGTGCCRSLRVSQVAVPPWTCRLRISLPSIVVTRTLLCDGKPEIATTPIKSFVYGVGKGVYLLIIWCWYGAICTIGEGTYGGADKKLACLGNGKRTWPCRRERAII